MTKIPTKLTIKQLDSYVSDLVALKQRDQATERAKHFLRRHLDINVYNSNLDNVFEIQDFGEMRKAIMAGAKFPPKRGSYSPRYRVWKELRGLPPHVKTGKMKRLTRVETLAPGRVFVWIERGATRVKYYRKGFIAQRTYDYGPIHERRKSVVKATAVFAWGHIRFAVLKAYVPT